MLRARHARRHGLDPIAAEVLVAPSPFAAPVVVFGALAPQREQRNAPFLRRTRTTRTGAGRSGESSTGTSSTTMPLTFSNRLNKPFNQGAFLGCISWSKNKPTGSAPHTLGFNGSPTNHHPRKQHKSQTSTMPLSRGSLRIIGWQGNPCYARRGFMQGTIPTQIILPYQRPSIRPPPSTWVTPQGRFV